MPLENAEIFFENKEQKISKDFRREILRKIANTEYCKGLKKAVNVDDITLLLTNLIKADSLFCFLKIIHYICNELFLLYNARSHLVFNDNLSIDDINKGGDGIDDEFKIIETEQQLITELLTMFAEQLPDQYCSLLTTKQYQARLSFNYYFSELGTSESVTKSGEKIIQATNLCDLLSPKGKDVITKLTNVGINFEVNIKTFVIVAGDFEAFYLTHKKDVAQVKEGSKQVALISNVINNKQYLVDLEDYNHDDYVNSFQKKLKKSIDNLKTFINNIENCKIMDYYYELNTSTQAFDVNSLEGKIFRICNAIDNEFMVLKKINQLFTNNLTTNFIVNYVKEAIMVKETIAERIKEIKLQFSRNHEVLLDEKNKSIALINKKIAALENIKEKEELTYQDLSKSLEDLNVTNYQKMITDLKQQIKKIEMMTKEKLTRAEQDERTAIELETNQKTEQLAAIKNKVIADGNVLKDNIKEYYQKIIEFIKFFTISLHKFVLGFESNNGDREKYKLTKTINNKLLPGAIIKVEYQDDNFQKYKLKYQLQGSNFIYLKTENEYYLVLAVVDNLETNVQLLTKEAKKNLIKELIDKQQYYLLPKKFCNLYTKFTLLADHCLSEKEVAKLLKKIALISDIAIIKSESPELTNDKQKAIYQAELVEIFNEIEAAYQALIALKTTLSLESTVIINDSSTIEITNDWQDLLQIVDEHINKSIADIKLKVKAIIEVEFEEIMEKNNSLQVIIEKKDVEIKQLVANIAAKEEEVMTLQQQLQEMISKKDTTTMSCSDKTSYDSHFLSIFESDLAQDRNSNASAKTITSSFISS